LKLKQSVVVLERELLRLRDPNVFDFEDQENSVGDDDVLAQTVGLFSVVSKVSPVGNYLKVLLLPHAKEALGRLF